MCVKSHIVCLGVSMCSMTDSGETKGMDEWKSTLKLYGFKVLVVLVGKGTDFS